MNKRFAAGTAAVLTAALLCVPASAHCGHSRAVKAKAPAVCSVCTLEDCETLGRHIHSGVTYCGYDHENGVCDGKCRALCDEEDCAITGLHTHNGTTCCGSHHDEGFCDGSCQTAKASSHHNSHHGHH